jgi:hypothetical protein
MVSALPSQEVDLLVCVELLGGVGKLWLGIQAVLCHVWGEGMYGLERFV